MSRALQIEYTYHANSTLRRWGQIVCNPRHQWWKGAIHPTCDCEQETISDARVFRMWNCQLSYKATYCNRVRDCDEDPTDFVSIAEEREQEDQHDRENVDGDGK